MKLKTPWWDFLIIVCLMGFGTIGLQSGEGWRPLWWAMALGGGFGLLLFSWNQGEEESKSVPVPKKGEE